MRVMVKNINRKEIRECYLAYIEEDKLIVCVTEFKIRLIFKINDEYEAKTLLDKLLIDGYYNFEYYDFEVEEL